MLWSQEKSGKNRKYDAPPVTGLDCISTQDCHGLPTFKVENSRLWHSEPVLQVYLSALRSESNWSAFGNIFLSPGVDVLTQLGGGVPCPRPMRMRMKALRTRTRTRSMTPSLQPLNMKAGRAKCLTRIDITLRKARWHGFQIGCQNDSEMWIVRLFNILEMWA